MHVYQRGVVVWFAGVAYGTSRRSVHGACYAQERIGLQFPSGWTLLSLAKLEKPFVDREAMRERPFAQARAHVQWLGKVPKWKQRKSDGNG